MPHAATKRHNSAWSKALALLMCLVVAATIATGTTSAYLKHQSNLIVNSFTLPTIPEPTPPSPVPDGSLSVCGTKTVEGGDWQGGWTFEFELEQGKLNQSGNLDWIVIGTQSVSADSPTFDFEKALEGVEFSEEGTYFFKLSEVNGNIEGVEYDVLDHHFAVIVSDDNRDGVLEIIDIMFNSEVLSAEQDQTSGAWLVNAEFVNRVTETQTAEVLIDITKVLSDTTGQNKAPEGFKFGAYNEAGELVTESNLTLADGEAQIRLTFDETSVGASESFVVKEIVPNDPVLGMEYDETEHRLVVTAEFDDDGNLTAKVEGETELSFENVYDPSDAELVISGLTKLTGRDLVENEFAFEFYAANEITPVDTANNSASGSFSFDKLTFSEVGEYRYTVKQIEGDLEGVTYDKSLYNVVVTVTDDGSGRLLADVTYTKLGSGDVEGIVFENVYTETEDPIEPPSPEDPDEPETPDKPEDPVTPQSPENPSSGSEGSSMGQTGDDLPISITVLSVVVGFAAIMLVVSATRLRKSKL